MASDQALETLCSLGGCAPVAIESAQIHFETGGGGTDQSLLPSSLYCGGCEFLLLPLRALMRRKENS